MPALLSGEGRLVLAEKDVNGGDVQLDERQRSEARECSRVSCRRQDIVSGALAILSALKHTCKKDDSRTERAST